MAEGIIVKALSGFYYVDTPEGIIECRARGKFRMDGTSPLVGDRVRCSVEPNGKGRIDSLYERRNFFIRPAVANIDTLVFVAANTNPVTDPFLIDRVSVIAAEAECRLLLCINKTDIDTAEELYDIFTRAGFDVIRTSAETGEGIESLREALRGQVCAFTGNSGVGKSSVLNALLPGANIETGAVSERLGRGKHTTRHVQLYELGNGTYIADTPGFASLDVEMLCEISKENIQHCFIEFAPYIGKCRFNDCAHLKEPGCAVRQAVDDGEITASRYRSYQRLYEIAAQRKSWEV
ncbi:MAG: ribosome small subunit-dependent GTPase A [Candidatus Limivicinus sp.]|nr:ribosome small subunit-dependent GTPase A [Clostridiales bacterium]MDY3860264.1 ribosome small subunit-dependent GTPase A [Candidatus Limivicinus sp.]